MRPGRVAVALLAWPCLSAAAQHASIDTVTVEFRALLSSDATPARVRRQALEGALAEAVRRVGGVRVTSTVLSTREERSGGARMRDEFSSVVQLDAGALVVDYAVLDSGWTTARTGAGEEQPYYRVVVRALVAREEGTRDPAFAVSLVPSTTLLRVRGEAAANDELVATIRSTRDGFVTLLSIADDLATVLIPDAYLTGQAVRAGALLQLPADEWRERGLHLRAALPTGVVERSELLVAVVTRTAVAPPPADGRVVDFQRWLVGIPVTERATATAVIRVVRQ